MGKLVLGRLTDAFRSTGTRRSLQIADFFHYRELRDDRLREPRVLGSASKGVVPREWILRNLDIQDLTHRVYNFRKVTFPEREHLNWCKQQSSRHEYKWVGSNHFGLEENR